MYVLINKKIGRNLEKNNGNDIMDKKRILVIGRCNNNYIKKLLESNYEIIVADETDYSNLKGYNFDFIFIDEYAEIKLSYNDNEIDEEELIKKENNRIQNNNMLAGLRGYKSKKYKRYF